jgi:hypothetical protein
MIVTANLNCAVWRQWTRPLDEPLTRVAPPVFGHAEPLRRSRYREIGGLRINGYHGYNFVIGASCFATPDIRVIRGSVPIHASTP